MERYIATPEKMVFGGSCLAKISGKNVFIPFAIPGEKIEIEITKSFRDYDTARITRIIERSPHRVQPFCPLYGKCGGCNMQHIESSFQVELRKSMLRSCFERAGLACPEIQVIRGHDRGYRARIQLTDGGFSAKESNTILQTDFCPVATDEINRYLKSVSQDKRPRGRVHFFGDKRIVSSSQKDFDHLVVACEEKKDLWEQRQIGKSKKKARNKVRQRFAGTQGNSPNCLAVSLLGKKIEFDAQGFFQSNMEVLEKTIETLTAGLAGNNALDMYSGAGTFSVFLADIFKKTFMVEHNRDALVHAEVNMAGKSHEAYGLSGAKWVMENSAMVIKNNGPFDAAVIDPPRSGMEKEVCLWLCKNAIPIIRSVSCDPSTQARDAALLTKAGYTMEKLFLLDFYPQTAHIESLAYFKHL